MSEHHVQPTIERRCDVVVVGGSAAGLATALQIARQRRSVIVVDAGEPRNAPAEAMHGFLTRDGTSPSELTALARAEVRTYGVEVLAGRVDALRIAAPGSEFVAELTGGVRLRARRCVIASGIVDHLPDVDGLHEHWGADVVHCPFCHGYEMRDRRIVSLITRPIGLHPATLFHHLASDLTLVLHDGVAVDDAGVQRLRRAGATVVDEPAARVESDGGGVTAVATVTGRRIETDVVAVIPSFRPRLGFAEPLDLETATHPSGLGEHVVVDDRGMTSVSGVYAVGNVVDPSMQVVQAAANGSLVGAMVCFDLADEDIDTSTRASANAADWDARYDGDQLWSGNPNGSLVVEATGLDPGRALDVGAGEGGDAVWLAEHGWQVTANDISIRALDRLASHAADSGLAIDTNLRDVNSVDPFDGRTYDLVAAHYASIPRTPDDRGLDNIVEAVADGGTLLVVGHDLEPMRQPIDVAERSRPFDPDAYLRVDDVAAALSRRGDWTIEVHEHRERPPGAASHHSVDVVFRARRTG